MNQNTLLFTQKVELAEKKENGNIIAKFILCDFDTNKNKVRLNRDTIENWYATIVNQPLVGRVIGNDFTSHRLRKVSRKDKDGNIVQTAEFDTDAFGTFTSAKIEKIKDVEYLTATAEIWGRFTKVCDLIEKRIKNGTLHTSWEILINEKHMDGDIKVIDDGIFEGHCLLGANVEPAFDSSRLLEVASQEEDEELNEAIIAEASQIEEDNMKKEKTKAEVAEAEVEPVVETEPTEEVSAVEVVEPEVQPEAQPEEQLETSALTDRDIRCELEKKFNEGRNEYAYCTFIYPADFYALFHSYRDKEMDFIAVTYTVSETEVTIVEKTPVTLVAAIKDINSVVAQKDEALLKANEAIQTLKAENETLKPYKEQAELAAKEKAEEELAKKRKCLSDYALKSKLISQDELDNDEAIKKMIADVDEDAVKQLIATRFMASLEESTKEKETSEVKTEVTENVTTNLAEDEVGKPSINPISVYINY